MTLVIGLCLGRTDPLQAQIPRPLGLQAHLRSPTLLELSWTDLGPDHGYSVETSSTLNGDWITELSAGPWPSTATHWSYALNPSRSPLFVRVRALNLIADPIEGTPLDHLPDELLAVLHPGGSAAAIAARQALEVREDVLLAALELHLVRFGLPRGQLLEPALERLRADAGVANASRNTLARPQQAITYEDHLWPQQHGFFQLHADKAHLLATGKSVRVAVIDTGLDLDHPEFAGRVQPDDCYSALTGDNHPYDPDNGHGTHVAGIILAPSGNDGIVGIAPD
ncbi:MAG: S8 family serine peptidase, partial [Verrucomicrobia bacterium]|nr:S8 family serine peptidase [Verrucomicrobiota bacterium]